MARVSWVGVVMPWVVLDRVVVVLRVCWLCVVLRRWLAWW